MKVYWSPSAYRNDISRYSMKMSCSFSVALNERSTMLPVSRLRNLATILAPPRPIFWCWYSMTSQRPPSISTLVPVRRSVTLIIDFLRGHTAPRTPTWLRGSAACRWEQGSRRHNLSIQRQGAKARAWVAAAGAGLRGRYRLAGDRQRPRLGRAFGRGAQVHHRRLQPRLLDQRRVALGRQLGAGALQRHEGGLEQVGGDAAAAVARRGGHEGGHPASPHELEVGERGRVGDEHLAGEVLGGVALDEVPVAGDHVGAIVVAREARRVRLLLLRRPHGVEPRDRHPRHHRQEQPGDALEGGQAVEAHGDAEREHQVAEGDAAGRPVELLGHAEAVDRRDHQHLLRLEPEAGRQGAHGAPLERLLEAGAAHGGRALRGAGEAQRVAQVVAAPADGEVEVEAAEPEGVDLPVELAHQRLGPREVAVGAHAPEAHLAAEQLDDLVRVAGGGT